MDIPEPTYSEFSIGDNVLDFSRPVVMGILNTTPDSFSDGGLFVSKNAAIDRIGTMVEDGAQIIDVGGESTRPGSEPVSVDEELERVLPVLEEAVIKYQETLFSIDTTKYEVAKRALDLGVHFINDVSGLRKEPRFADLCADYQVGYILMHSQGDPKTMQKDPYYSDVIQELNVFFSKRLEQLNISGVKNVILDPGIGFGKTLEHNLNIIRKLDTFTQHGIPLLVGASRKSMIGQILNDREVNGRLAGTIAVHYHCLIKGAGILRVHDVKEAVDSVKIFQAIKDG
jgi:dihydropteroate synthase